MQEVSGSIPLSSTKSSQANFKTSLPKQNQCAIVYSMMPSGMAVMTMAASIFVQIRSARFLRAFRVSHSYVTSVLPYILLV